MEKINFTTSQHVSVEYQLAGTLLRVAAALLDVIFVIVYWFILNAVLGFVAGISFYSGYSSILSYIFFSLPIIFYSAWNEYFFNGRTLGKRICGIRVVSLIGHNASIRAIFTRWMFRWIDLWGTCGFLAIFFSATSSNQQRIGDMLAGTVVIKNTSSSMVGLNQYQLSDLNIEDVTYHGLSRFTDNEILVLKRTIARVRLAPTPRNKKMVLETAQKMGTLLGLKELPEKAIPFLNTIIRDYVIQTR